MAVSKKSSNAKRSMTVKVRKAPTMAAAIDEVVQSVKDPEEIIKTLKREAQRRSVKEYSLGMVRAHIRFRQAHGRLTNVELPSVQPRS